MSGLEQRLKILEELAAEAPKEEPVDPSELGWASCPRWLKVALYQAVAPPTSEFPPEPDALARSAWNMFSRLYSFLRGHQAWHQLAPSRREFRYGGNPDCPTFSQILERALAVEKNQKVAAEVRRTWADLMAEIAPLAEREPPRSPQRPHPAGDDLSGIAPSGSQ